MLLHEPSLDDLFSTTYEELRRLAASIARGDGSETLRPTALVNEAYVKLSASLRVQPQSQLHFKRLAARAMRQILVESARRRHALKRGGNQAFVTLDDERAGFEVDPEEVIALDTALEQLGRLDPRQALVVEYRFFGGYDLAETAALLEVSEATVVRDWRSARAWLARELRRGS